MVEKIYEEGDHIVRMGDVADSIFFVKDGEVSANQVCGYMLLAGSYVILAPILTFSTAPDLKWPTTRPKINVPFTMQLM